LIGVGFGRASEFYLDLEDPSTGVPYRAHIEIGQDPHNGYMWLLAGGGIAALGAFLLIVTVFAVDAVRRYRSTADPIERLIVTWAGVTLFVFLVNAASGTMFESPSDLLTIWALLVLPAVVPRGSRVPSSRSGGDRLPQPA
jgi:O-antigen ligase